MKRLASILLVAALGSCSKGNTDSPTPPAPATSQISLVPAQPIDYISKIEAYQVFKTGPSTFGRSLYSTYTFEYDDQKRLVSVMPGKSTISFGEDLLTLNAQGRVTKHERTLQKKNKEGVLVKEVVLKGKDYVYDSEGHQLSHTTTEYSTKSEWKEGNLVKRTYTYANGNPYHEPDVWTKEYSSIPNRSFPDLNLLASFVEPRGSQPYLWSHIKGMRSAKLISSQSAPLYYDDGKLRATLYNRWSYKLDTKGRPYDIEIAHFFNDFHDRSIAYVITYLDK
nr:hypothetical protein [uncultured Porphyromonas sp.]